MRETSVAKKEDLRFSKYLAPNLDLRNRLMWSNMHYIGCANACLSMLTELSPRVTVKDCKTKHIGWYTGPVIKWLRKKGFKVIELSKQDVLNTHWETFPLKSDHCLLVNCRVESNENSMVLIHDNVVWHNFKPQPFTGLYFLNKPTQDVLLVYHPKWAKLHKKQRVASLSWI